MAPGAALHVLHVVPTLRPGGMELALARVVNGLLSRGVTHSIIVLKGEALIRDRIDAAVRVHCVHAGAHDPLVALRLRRLILSEAPSVIHARNLGAWPEIAAARLMAYPLVPLVFSFHGVAEARPVPARWRLLCRILSRLTSEVFTVSEGSKRFLVEHVGLREQDVAVIPNGVDTRRFAPTQRAHTTNELLVGTVGSLTPVKNQALLIRACARVIQQGLALRLDIVGEGRERPALEGLVRSLGMTGRVRLLGHIDDIPAFLNSLDLFVLPSDSEAHPNALSEAMACGLACIASRVGGVAEIADQGRAALLFERGDESALTGSIADLVANPERRRALGRAAVEVTRARYSLDDMLSRYMETYQRIADGMCVSEARG